MTLQLIESDFGRGLATSFEPTEEDANKVSATFMSANGHALSTYGFYTDELAQRFNLYALENRAVWPSTSADAPNANWSDFVDDYIAYVEARGLDDGSLVHIGHSLGASIGMMAALKRPELFKQLVMIEPGSSPSFPIHLIYRLLPQQQRYRFKFINSTRGRRNGWPSENAFMSEMRTKTMYKNFSALGMQGYAEGGLIKKESANGDDEYKLKFDPAWEAHIFTDVPYVLPMIKKLKVPTLLLRAGNSHLFTQKLFDDYTAIYKRKNPLITTQTIPDAGHLIIQEQHQKVLEAVDQWLSR